jgi:hypothetical protein
VTDDKRPACPVSTHRPLLEPLLTPCKETVMEKEMTTMDEETMERLHQVLAYLLEDEAENYWSADPLPEDHIYPNVIWLVRRFRFEDLLEVDAEMRPEGETRRLESN